MQSLVETTPCSLCKGLGEYLVFVDQPMYMTMWMPCVCVTPEEPDEMAFEM